MLKKPSGVTLAPSSEHVFYPFDSPSLTVTASFVCPLQDPLMISSADLDIFVKLFKVA